ncbi:hypothetical protein Tco_1071437 [Tanacetum coccineum]
MVNVIPSDHVDDVPIVELNQHDDVLVLPEFVLVNEDEDLEEDEFEEEEDPQEEEDDMEVDIEEDENEPELTYPYEEVDPVNPSPPASESESEDAIEVKKPIKPRMRISSVEQGMAAMEKLVEKIGNAEDKAECKKLKKELEEARGQKVKFAIVTLQGPAFTWWNAKIATMGLETVNQMPWTEMKQLMTGDFYYTQRFNELALMCPRMVEPERVKVVAYIRGLTDNIKGGVTSSKPANLNEACVSGNAPVATCSPIIGLGIRLSDESYHYNCMSCWEKDLERIYSFRVNLRREPQDEEEHGKHLKIILELLKKERFGVHVDPAKIEAIKSWAAPMTPTEKDKKYKWGEEEEEEVFQTLKHVDPTLMDLRFLSLCKV